MSNFPKGSYKVVGGDVDGEIYDDVADEDVEALQETVGANWLEPVDPPAVEPPDPTPSMTVTRESIDETPPPYALPSVQRDPTYEPNTGDSWQDNALDTLMGAAAGATAAGADEIVGVADNLGLYDALEHLGLYDRAAFGDPQKLYREGNAQARERSPWLYHGAEAAAAAPMAIAAGSMGLGALPSWLATGAGSTALGALQGTLASDAPDLAGRLAGGGRGALTGAVLHGMGEGLNMTAGIANWARPTLQSISNEARNAVFGEPGDFRRLADARGLQRPADAVRERLGIERPGGNPRLDFVFNGPADIVREQGLTNRIVPQSARDYANRTLPIKEAEGAALGANLDAAGRELATHTHKGLPDELVANNEVPLPELPPGPDSTVRTLLPDDVLLGYQPELAAPLPEHLQEPSMAGELLGHERVARGGTNQTSSLANQYARLRGKLAELPGEMLPPRELNDLKGRYYDEAYDARAGSQPDTIAEEAAATAGASANRLLRGALAQHSDPNVLRAYNDQANTYGELSLIEQMARNKAAGSQGQQAPGGLFSTLTGPLTRTIRKYGPDLTANVTQLGADAAGGVAKKLTPGVIDAPRMLARALAGPAEQGAGRIGTEGPNTQPTRGMSWAEEPPARGVQHDLDLAGSVLRVLEQNPIALGPFADKLKQLAASPDPSALNTELIRLVQTNPAFRANVLPQL